MKYPEKKNICSRLLKNKKLSWQEIPDLNQKIFGKANKNINQKHHSFKKEDIIEILIYQKNNHLKNYQLAKHFEISRKSVTKWKKLFQA